MPPMSRFLALAAIAAAAAVAGPAAAAPKKDNAEALAKLDAELPGTLIDDPTSLDWNTQGADLKAASVADANIPGGGAAALYRVRKASDKPYSAQAYVPLTADIATGDTITFGFWAKCDSSAAPDGKCAVGTRVQRNVDPWPGFGDQMLAIGTGWKWYEATVTATIDIRKNDAVLVFQVGGAKQDVEIGQTIVVKGAERILGNGARPAVVLPPQIDGKGRLISQPDNREWTFFGPDSAHAQREDATIYLGSAVRVTVPEKGAHAYDIHANVPLTEEIKAGDKLLIAIAAKTVSATADDGKALIGMRVQWNQPPYDGFADHTFSVGPNWQLIQIQTTAPSDIPAGKGLVVLHLAGAAQVLDLGPTYVLKMPAQ